MMKITIELDSIYELTEMLRWSEYHNQQAQCGTAVDSSLKQAQVSKFLTPKPVKKRR